MNQYAIICQLAFFYTLYAPVQATRQKIHKIKEAKIYHHVEDESFEVFSNGKVHLYKTSNDEGDDLKYYLVGDESDRYSTAFPIAQYNTVVTKEVFTIRWHDATIILTLNESTFAFYQRFFSLGNFPRQFPVDKVFQNNQELEIEFGVSAIKAKQVENGEWNFAVLHRNTPRIIFPKSCVAFLLPKGDFDKKVTVTLDIKPQITVIIQFDNSTIANMLYNFIKNK